MRRNWRVLLRLIRMLFKIGLFRPTIRRKGEVGIFFVHKSKGCKIRLILDCRPSNQMFRPPSSIPLATTESMCAIELELEPSGDAHLLVGVSDIDNCCHQLRLSRGLSEWFCLDVEFTAKELGLGESDVDSLVVQDDDTVWVCSNMAPIGFCWSLLFAQRTSEHLFAEFLVRGLEIVQRPDFAIGV